MKIRKYNDGNDDNSDLGYNNNTDNRIWNIRSNNLIIMVKILRMLKLTKML